MYLLFSIITEYSLWFIPLCIVVGVGLSFLLYFKDQKLKDAPRYIRYLMATLRAVVVTLLCFLLLSPFVESLHEKILKPIIVLAVDDSESILLNKDSAYNRTVLPEKLNSFVEKVQEKYELVSYSFGENVDDKTTFSYDDKITKFSDLFEEIKTKFFNRNVGALVLVTDGIYTQGNNPYYSFEQNRIDAPVYSLALGDTLHAIDLLIKDVEYNKTVFMGSKFPVNVTVEANFLKGETYELRIISDNETIIKEAFVIETNASFVEYTFYIEPNEVGVKQYDVELSRINNELTYANNHSTFIVDVMKSKKQILLLYNAPHPDIGVLRSAITKNVNYDVTVSTPKEFRGKLEDFNLLILHQLPSANNALNNEIATIIKKGIPVLYVLGQHTNFDQLRKVCKNVSIVSKSKNFDEVVPAINEKFTLFDLDQSQRDFLMNVPPLYVPFGEYTIGLSAKVLAYQGIGSVETTKPLIFFSEEQGVRTGVIAGEGIWRWRMTNQKKYKNAQLFNNFVNKIVAYLALKETKEQFKVKNAAVYAENVNVIIEAELYNDSYELTNEVDVDIIIKDSVLREFPFVFSKTNNAYRLDVGNLPVGRYTFEAKTTLGEKQFVKKGLFSIIPVNIEAGNTLANHNDLFKLAALTDGKVFYPRQEDQLLDEVLNNNNIVSVSHSTKELMNLIDLWWLLVLILVLLSVEWFCRKYFASY